MSMYPPTQLAGETFPSTPTLGRNFVAQGASSTVSAHCPTLG